MTVAVRVDITGAQMGGAARYAAELHDYLPRTVRHYVWLHGERQSLNSPWLVRRELIQSRNARRGTLNNVRFLRPGGPQ